MWVRDFPHHECQKILSKSRGEAEWFGRNFLARMVRKILYSHFRSHSISIVEKYKQQSETYWNNKISFFNFFLFLYFFLSNWSNQHAFFIFLPHFCIFCNFFLSKWRNHYANPRWQPYFNNITPILSLVPVKVIPICSVIKFHSVFCDLCTHFRKKPCCIDQYGTTIAYWVI